MILTRNLHLLPATARAAAAAAAAVAVGPVTTHPACLAPNNPLDPNPAAEVAVAVAVAVAVEEEAEEGVVWVPLNR
jgi:hypothetical protein